MAPQHARPGDLLRLAVNGKATHVGILPQLPDGRPLIHAYAPCRKVVEHGWDGRWPGPAVDAGACAILDEGSGGNGNDCAFGRWRHARLLALAGGGDALRGDLVGAMIGQAVGGMAGAAVDSLFLAPSLPRQRVEGPRLSELRVTGADYGTGIPLAYGGSVRLAGTVLWLSDVIESRKKRTEGGGGKGGGGGAEIETVEYRYHLDLALGLCAGPIADVRRLWADGHVIWEYGQTKPSSAEGNTVNRGDEEQLPDPLIVAQEGGNVRPSGAVYIVLERLALHRHGAHPEPGGRGGAAPSARAWPMR